MTSGRDHIFISYRRDDASGASGRLYDWLRIAFGSEHVFRDVHSIGVGKWRDRIGDALGRSAVCVAELEHVRHLQSDHIHALGRTVEELRRKLAEASAGERPGLAAAFAALAQGNSLVAERSFEREYDAQSRRADEARQTMAEAARNVANLALLHDVAKAVSFYRRALDAEPEHAETARLLVEALILKGDLPGAEAAFSESLRTAIARDDSWGEIAAQLGLGVVLQRTKDLSAANRAFGRALSLAEERLATDRSNRLWQNVLSVSHEKIGDTLAAQGDGPGALAAYRKGLDIAEALTARDPTNAEWQRDLSVSHHEIGDMLAAQGDGLGALAAYRKGLAIAEALAARDPADTEWQRDLSVSHNKIGSMLAAQDGGPGALAAYRKGLAIREALVARDPANTEWQRDLSVSHNRIGDMLAAQGDGPGALAACREGLAIREALAARDPANANWQHDLSVSHEKIGDLLAAQGDGSGARAAYRRGLVIGEALAARDPANAQWQTALARLIRKTRGSG